MCVVCTMYVWNTLDGALSVRIGWARWWWERLLFDLKKKGSGKKRKHTRLLLFLQKDKKERHTYNETYTALVIVTRTVSPSVTSMVGPGYCPFAAYNHLRADKMLLQSGEADDKGDVSSPPRDCSNVKSYSTRSAFTNISKDDDDNNDPPFVVNNSSAATKVAEILLKRDEGEFIVVVSNLYLFVCRSSL